MVGEGGGKREWWFVGLTDNAVRQRHQGPSNDYMSTHASGDNHTRPEMFFAQQWNHPVPVNKKKDRGCIPTSLKKRVQNIVVSGVRDRLGCMDTPHPTC